MPNKPQNRNTSDEVKKMHDKLSKSFLDSSLPILEKEYNKRYNKMNEIFKKVITSETEDKEFFKSPVNYLKKKGALIMESIRLPSGEVIPFIEDKVLVDTIRKAREMYKAGIIDISKIQTGIGYYDRETAGKIDAEANVASIVYSKIEGGSMSIDNPNLNYNIDAEVTAESDVYSNRQGGDNSAAKAYELTDVETHVDFYAAIYSTRHGIPVEAENVAVQVDKNNSIDIVIDNPMITKDDRNSIRIDDRFIGPLVNPEVFEPLRKMFPIRKRKR